jgi:hypothetical protein
VSWDDIRKDLPKEIQDRLDKKKGIINGVERT